MRQHLAPTLPLRRRFGVGRNLGVGVKQLPYPLSLLSTEIISRHFLNKASFSFR